MNVRASQSSDKQAIISLLKLSLGEGLLKKSQTVWDFKHEQNPFGTSYVLLAFETTELIGVRALMQWRWQQGNKLWTAYRAVDTATHPNHQGKGIFKKLTLQALDDVAQKGDCFIFNTPNEKSRPGYLKMGWQEVSAIPLALIPIPVYGFHYLFSKKQPLTNTITPSRLEEICQLHNTVLSKKNSIFTPKSAAYLKWRFEDNPMQNYVVVSDEDWYVAMYVKRHRFFKELRVAEIINANPKEASASIRKCVIQFAFQNKCWLITSADKSLFGFRIFGKFGPKLTFKPLTQDTTFSNNALQIDYWEYSLGDLELF
ncbi:GNAT family N-acetyltransferase [Flavobacterium sp. J49]|uniref:GNAT family N-acetyltransferase n=1 Tax=Flavobacterium sp. J49 TaxID=2718534 RepID=UPI001592EDA2|nr:GNAT family N-acetyltransferase [Flavobacterium sp. J49]MBF6640011.1 GNAT family N-acetyltransferase [Flavobacterium sp. J49]NIC01256.1 GNAT family N-acetyltransferase [Flavobacterium sp. J49]